jgi:hypothetical protein
MKRSRSANLPASIQQQLTMYAIAAGAAAGGLLALSQPCEAKIVHRRLNVTLQGIESYYFNPANQGVAPFHFSASFINRTNTWWNRLFLTPTTSAAGPLLAKNKFISELQAGATIGKSGTFARGASYGLLFTYGPYGGGTFKHHRGNFAFGQTDYLGFKFNIGGKEHFGWVRMKVSIRRFPGKKITVTVLHDYGYETIPGKSIKAGQTQSTADDFPYQDLGASLTTPVPETQPPATLGLLALGAPGLSIWRRESVGVTP